MATIARSEPLRSPAPIAKPASRRLTSIDALRGLVMVIMLLDHVRETWFLHMQVSDPMDARAVMPALFLTRYLSTICAPVFVGLTGLSAFLYGRTHSAAQVSRFLVERGLFLMLLELTFVNFAWTGVYPPQTIWFQVIWAIGVAMIALAAMLHLPRKAIFAIGFVIVCGHNLLDGLHAAPGSALFAPWAMLHERQAWEFAGITFKTTYPVLPWIGLIALGYCMGPWFANEVPAGLRRRRLVLTGSAMLAAFFVMRGLNIYGDAPRFVVEGDALRTAMSFMALTKYPPSLFYLLFNCGLGLVLLAGFEKIDGGRLSQWLSVMGGAPMFFYLLHLYVLKALYVIAFAIWGATQGKYFGVDSLAWVWVWYVGLIVPLYFPTRWFSNLKKRRRDIWWLKYL
ncbi:DUF1624 domain-containing protein [Novosphingobium sp. RL4]|uniref:DUF1624 domain-containing protein n=1 Tax=Novosphingobium sp. RL4 TaxID=3109595 RepID=UPI002D774F63|nr:heparan-alpha-glucosaminide N-acetyltransferase domain-containing protein [Novosphingobium sp. RL4]WRT96068.1 heparan-alpha-glucosaminide N-acetyltransferase domain-containing protein [Novosphingobium sp. RL4]